MALHHLMQSEATTLIPTLYLTPWQIRGRMRRAALAGGAEVRFLRLAEPGGQLREPRGSALLLPPGAAAAGAAWSPDGHLLALATQVPSGARCAGAALRQGTGSCMLAAAPVWSCQKRGSV